MGLKNKEKQARNAKVSQRRPRKKIIKNGGGQSQSCKNNNRNEFSTIKLLRMQIFSKIRQLLKKHYHRGIINFFWGKNPQRGNYIF